MRNFLVVMGHTYLMKVKSKAFITTTLITILFLFLFLNIDRVFGVFDASDPANSTEQHVVVQANEAHYAIAEEQAEEKLLMVVPTGDAEKGEQQVLDGEADGLLILTEASDGSLEAEYKATSTPDNHERMELTTWVDQIHSKHMLEEAGVGEDFQQLISAGIELDFSSLQQDAAEHSTAEERSQTTFLVYILLFVIYFSVIFLGNMVSMEVATEKSSRVMEILISSVSPEKQMFGKIAGIALLGLTQFALIFLIGASSMAGRFQEISTMTGTEMDGGEELFGAGTVSLSLIGYAFLFFVLGFLLYATLSAMLGSIISRIEDVGQATGPLNMVVIAGFVLAVFGLNAPNSLIVTIASFVPFFAPMLMFLRIGMTNVPFWELALSIGILIGTIALFAWIGARVYRNGVLMYGKFRLLQDIKRALNMYK
ncbi:ABC transporter permease [Salsuginibacillus kocurii]|uniref:ABC transporter permease n=1 Tax=Salsuginibacillus kocurii TaxID=427078 RepID=UPI00036BC131|nr:ABC transporter permease [Salsuginibacillus kocurii]